MLTSVANAAIGTMGSALLNRGEALREAVTSVVSCSAHSFVCGQASLDTCDQR
jgi:hypothetical protein